MSQLGLNISTIASRKTTDPIQLDGNWLTGVDLPAGIASTKMNVLVCDSKDGTFHYVYHAGKKEYTVAASSFNTDVSDELIFANWIELEFDQTETAKTYRIISQPLK